jgi:hypothetical protein
MVVRVLLLCGAGCGVSLFVVVVRQPLMVVRVLLLCGAAVCCCCVSLFVVVLCQSLMVVRVVLLCGAAVWCCCVQTRTRCASLPSPRSSRQAWTPRCSLDPLTSSRSSTGRSSPQ